MAIQSFGDAELEDFFLTGTLPHRCPWQQVVSVAQRKLDMLQAAHELEDLRVPPSNHLELLKGNLAGFYSIRVNKQWRVTFRWTDAGPDEVRIVDYH